MIYRLAKHIVWGDEAKPLVLIHELAALLYGLVEAAPGHGLSKNFSKFRVRADCV
jgi:hypothetical protein